MSNDHRTPEDKLSAEAMAKRAAHHGAPQTEEEAMERLREKGIDDEAVLSAGTTAHGSTQRYWQCPLCKHYMDAFLEIDGMEQIASPDRIKCSSCGCQNLDTVEGDFFQTDKHGEIMKAEYVPPRDKEMFTYTREGSALLDDCGFFTEDPKDNEPIWPRYMSAVIAGAAMRVNATLASIDQKLGVIAGLLSLKSGAGPIVRLINSENDAIYVNPMMVRSLIMVPGNSEQTYMELDDGEMITLSGSPDDIAAKLCGS